MTDTERNELVEKLATKITDSERTVNRNPDKVALNHWINYWIANIEALGYEIVKKEALKQLNDAFVLQQVRAGNFTRIELGSPIDLNDPLHHGLNSAKNPPRPPLFEKK